LAVRLLSQLSFERFMHELVGLVFPAPQRLCIRSDAVPVRDRG
jgi:hypothetical protein